MKTEHKVTVENGKYTFVVPADDYRVSILRYGEAWHGPQAEASGALHAIMCELDTARAVVQPARAAVDSEPDDGLDNESMEAEGYMSERWQRGLTWLRELRQRRSVEQALVLGFPTEET